MRRYRRKATVTIEESPGAELWFTIHTATSSFRVPHWVGLDEVWKGINEGWSSRPSKRTLHGGERRYSVPLADWVAFDAWRKRRDSAEP